MFLKGVNQMAKSSNVVARVEPEIKEQAEDILTQLGLPVSVVINALYRQIIMRNGLPFSMTVPSGVVSRDTMSDAEFHAMMKRGLAQAKQNDSVPLEEAMADLMQGI